MIFLILFLVCWFNAEPAVTKPPTRHNTVHALAGRLPVSDGGTVTVYSGPGAGTHPLPSLSGFVWPMAIHSPVPEADTATVISIKNASVELAFVLSPAPCLPTGKRPCAWTTPENWAKINKSHQADLVLAVFMCLLGNSSVSAADLKVGWVYAPDRYRVGPIQPWPEWIPEPGLGRSWAGLYVPCPTVSSSTGAGLK